MNILITGARAPIAIEWAYRLKFSRSSVKIIMADSMRLPIGRFTNTIERYYYIRSPMQSPRLFIEDILSIVVKEGINLIIPTCEEIFYLSKLKHFLPTTTHLFTDEFEKLSLLHNKFLFIKNLVDDTGIHKPKTYLINSQDEFLHWKTKHDTNDYILKPVFSRFGSETILDISKIRTAIRYPVVAQQKISGRELCSYSLSINGKIIVHSCYHPKYKAGLGAGIYFQPEYNQEIIDFVKSTARKFSFTGQIAFDFIADDYGHIYPIECNPRGTSGLYLIPELNILELITKPKESKYVTHNKPYQVKFGMWLYSANHIKGFGVKQFIKDYKNALDIYSEKKLHYLQFISFFEILIRSFSTRFNLKKAATQDIEWDGHEITES
ncbi:MAG: hypothetical protein QWI36_00795 [Wolbachia endosymbiont of Tyrophagus putrescentiae]|nr:hypothetical protein [Wolbachia endosymbiont of Tyrophagus putrescentiae]